MFHPFRASPWLLVWLVLVGLPWRLGATGAPEPLVIKGSSTIFPICKLASSKYYLKTKKVVLCEGGGSGFGLKFAREGGLGSVSRDLSSEELASGLRATSIGMDGLAFVVNQASVPKLNSLSQAQLKQIFSGATKDWSLLASDLSGEIILLGPNPEHGTFDALLNFLNLKAPDPKMKTEGLKESQLSTNYLGFQSHNETIFRLESREKTLGVIPAAFWTQYKNTKKNKIRALKIDGVLPTPENLLNSTYSARRILNMVWLGEPKKATKDFLDFLKSKDGKNLIKELGFVPL